MSKKKLFLAVYGCQMNIADGERMAGELAALGYERQASPVGADMILLVTCCVRETAEEKIYGKLGEIKHLKEDNPRLIVGITGCMAQKEGERLLRRAPQLDFVLGTNKIGELAALVRRLEAARAAVNLENPTDKAEIRRALKKSRVVDVAEKNDIAEGMAIQREGKVSAWVPIMYGCNNFCTYCIVPYVRGRERSRRAADVIAEVKRAVADGYREITLLGQNVNSYGKDTQELDFAELLTEVDKVPGLVRLRYMTSHPKDLSDKVIDAVAGGRHICEHFHLPVQHGADRILRAMNRVYTTAQYRELVELVRSRVPAMSLTTDIIVGFPGETAADFRQLTDFLREIKYDQAYTFIYSQRSGTPAATMADQVPDEVKRARLNELMAVQNEISLACNEKLAGTVQEVLVEGPSLKDPAMWTGRTRANKIILWPHEAEQVGELARVEITQPQTWVLKGRLVR